MVKKLTNLFNKIKKYIITLIGINLLVIMHELGHFFACKLFDVRVFTFSLGFGGSIFSFNIGETKYQLALLPFGGYVEHLGAKSYFANMVIVLAGIAVNFLFYFIIVKALRLRLYNNPNYEESIIDRDIENQNALFSFTITEINQIQDLGFKSYLYALAIVSRSLAYFNAWPIPFLDGGQALFYTISYIYKLLA